MFGEIVTAEVGSILMDQISQCQAPFQVNLKIPGAFVNKAGRFPLL